MIHVLTLKHKNNEQPTLVHFHSVNELNGYYQNSIPGTVIANRFDLAALKEKHKADDMIKLLLDRIDEDSLNGVVCNIIDGKCVTTNDKPGKNSVNKPEKVAA